MQTQTLLNQQVDNELNKARTLSFLRSVKRPGINNLIHYLLESDYFTAPVSTHYHNPYLGGLCQHFLNVMLMFFTENKKWEKPIPQESVVICGILHDLCKVGAYTITEHGYEKVKCIKGHGRLSVSRIEEYIKLTTQEKDIILFHMGLFGIFEYHEYDTLAIHQAIIRTSQVQLFAALDMANTKRSNLPFLFIYSKETLDHKMK